TLTSWTRERATRPAALPRFPCWRRAPSIAKCGPSLTSFRAAPGRPPTRPEISAYFFAKIQRNRHATGFHENNDASAERTGPRCTGFLHAARRTGGERL